MKIKLLFLFLFLGFTISSIHSQNINWAQSKSIQSGYSSQVSCIKHSNLSETVYTCGWYYQMTAIPNTTNGMASSSAMGYISKQDSAGVTIWSKNIITTYTNTSAAFYPYSFVVDNRDNIYVVGYYGISAGFTYNIANIAFSGGRAYILKLDSSGAVLDTATFPTGGIKFLDIDLDANSNLYILGSSRSAWNYASTAIPNPTGSSSTLTRDFIMSCDSNLIPRWVKPLGTYDMSFSGGTGSTSDKSGMQKLTVDKTCSGSIYICGLFNANYSFQGQTFVINGTTKEDALIFKLDNSGNYVTGFSYGGVFHDALNSIQVNRFGKLVTSGYFYTSAVINGKPYTTTTGFPLCYVSVLDTNLNYIYVQTTGIASFATFSFIDDYGRVAFSTKQQNLINGTYLIFYSTKGNVTFSQSSTVTAGNGSSFYPQGICMSRANSQILYFAGNYKPSVTFGTNLTLTSQAIYILEIALLKYTIPSMQGALPVKWIDLELTECNGDISIDWSTASEANNSGFTIEKSLNGLDFNEIGFTKGVGNSNSINRYHFVDNKISNKVQFYRLKQIDFDGKYEFSKMLIYYPKEYEETSVIWPNPFNEYIYINESIIGVETKLFDLNGIQISLSTTNENGITKFQTNELNPGIYFLINNKIIEKLIKK
jgi:hypothetical protein